MITQETKPVKTWGGFNLAILKVNLNPLWKNRSCSTGLRPLTSYCYPPVETYWHDHMQTLKPRTPSFLDSLASTSTPACVSLKFFSATTEWSSISWTNLLLIILRLCKGKLLTNLTRDLHKQQHEQPKL